MRVSGRVTGRLHAQSARVRRSRVAWKRSASTGQVGVRREAKKRSYPKGGVVRQTGFLPASKPEAPNTNLPPSARAGNWMPFDRTQALKSLGATRRLAHRTDILKLFKIRDYIISGEPGITRRGVSPALRSFSLTSYWRGLDVRGEGGQLSFKFLPKSIPVGSMARRSAVRFDRISPD